MSSVVLTEIHGRVGLIRINRPEAMNALNNEVVDGIGAAIDAFETDDGIGCIVITGNEKAFAAGADIGFMKDFDYLHAYKTDFITRNWERIKTTRKPVIAAVAGFAPPPQGKSMTSMPLGIMENARSSSFISLLCLPALRC